MLNRTEDGGCLRPNVLLIWAAVAIENGLRPTPRSCGTSGPPAHQLLINGSANGLVEVTIDPLCRTGRALSTLFVRERVDSRLVSLEDPDGFIAAVEDDGHH
jgi:hypothetical protein